MESREEIFATLTKILAEEFEVGSEEITLDTHLYEDLDLDSIDAVDLVVKLQKVVGKKIAPDTFKQVRTISHVVDAIENLLKG